MRHRDVPSRSRIGPVPGCVVAGVPSYRSHPVTPHPVDLAYGLAVLMAVVAVYCIGRLALAAPMGRSNHADVNVGHVLMGVAMVGMLVPRLSVVPNGGWELVFAGFAVYFGTMGARSYGARRRRAAHVDRTHPVSHYVIHLVMSVAMVYMFHVGMPTHGPAAAMAMVPRRAPISDPGLTLVLITVLFASATWQVDVVSRGSRASALALVDVGVHGSGGSTAVDVAQAPPAERGRPFLAPRLEIGCHVAMCVTMGYMLILMV